MFYSETLLAKNGPLARVWLASNMEKKLSKQNIMAEHLETKVKDIISTGQGGQAPIALRLSGQLLLGVVRIYSRKARYLLDDCNEALSRIKMAFRPGNVDLPSNTTHVANAAQLMLPDTITELDLFAPLPDPSELLRGEPEARGPGRDPTLLDFGHSQLLPESQTPSRREQDRSRHFLEDDDDLGLEMGLEGEGETTIRSIEVGRRAATPRADFPTDLIEDDLGLDYGDNDQDTTIRPMPNIDEDVPMLNADDDMPLMQDDDENNEIAAANAAAFKRLEDAEERRQRVRDSVSPFSDLPADEIPDLEKSYHLSQLPARSSAQPGEEDEEDEEERVQAAQRVKRRKVVVMSRDSETELRTAQIKEMQQDRSAILKAPSFLPRDPVLLQLMEMQRTGGFVSSIMGDGRFAGMAPELRGVMSLEFVPGRSVGDGKKRKRDSGVADVERSGSEENGSSPPRLEIPGLEEEQEEDEGFNAGGGDFGNADPTLLHSDGAAAALMSDGVQPMDNLNLNDDDEPTMGGGDMMGGDDLPFDITEAPLLHPSHSGPVSLGTKNAVHLLREYFAPGHSASTNGAEPPTPSKRTKSEALFTDLCPEERCSVNDATKMFFELLVLGTKDAVKVSQDTSMLGGPIRVRGKRGLWGDWAERSAGGEIAAIQEGDEGMEGAAEVGIVA
ncbi:sister chromatid cohesion protein 1 [Elasticomyces elasticus]|nr:sister chromatid cohesion protein 1 [Elasticomyces elasticus]KAK4974601.1 sister chromatid cohesion protein 1 [Elasticomyces elasticus]